MTDVSVVDAINPSIRVSLYGNPLSGLNFEQDVLANAGFRGRSNETVGLAFIRAFKVNGACRRLPAPVILTVFGQGSDASPDDPCADDSSKVWILSSDDQVASISIEKFSLVDALDDAVEKGISGGIRLSNVRYENGKIRGDIQIWGKIKVLGGTASVKESFSFSIHVGGCHTVFDAGIAKVKVCYKAPNQICAELCVGKWGLEKCWDQCAEINMLSNQSSDAIDLRCDCNKGD
jgi:hypothetical protein